MNGSAKRQVLLDVVKSTAKTLLVGSAAVTGLGYLIESAKEINPPEPPERVVPVQFRDKSQTHGLQAKIHVKESGTGPVTVLLDPSLGGTMYEWSKVQSLLEQSSRSVKVLAIDRPGIGYSSPSFVPRDAEQQALDYETILSELQVSGPVILVGHGTGAYTMRVLSSKLREQSIGMVLVDPMYEKNRSRMQAISPSVANCLESRNSNVEWLYYLSYFGVTRFIDSVQSRRLQMKYESNVYRDLKFISGTTAHRRGVLRENQALELTEQFMKASFQDKRDQNVVILSHGKATMFNSMSFSPGIDLKTLQQLEDVWAQGQKELSEKFQHVRHEIVPDTGHFIPQEKPERIVQAVLSLLRDQK